MGTTHRAGTRATAVRQGRVASVLGLLLLATTLYAVAPASAAGVTNGPFLYFNALKNENGIALQPLPFRLQQGQALVRFSRDGTRLAEVRYDSATASSYLLVRTSAGGARRLDPNVGLVTDISWSPDGQTIAVLGSTSTTKAIRLMAADGSSAVTAYSTATTSNDFRLGSSVSWHPTQPLLAVVGTQLPETDTVEYPSQIYTIPTSGGSPTLYNAATTRFCEEDCVRVAYAQAEWSPDGSRMLVRARDDEAAVSFVGTTSQGQLNAARLRAVSGGDLALWSPDGTKVLFNDFSPALSAATMSADGGALSPLQDPNARDWMPCPDGECPTWSSEGEADLAASVRGVGARAAAGTVDTARATVENLGPDPALGVEIRLGVPTGITYGYVRRPGTGWTCDVTSARFIRCASSSPLPAGASATLTASLHALEPQDQQVRIAVRVASATPDPDTSNNSVAELQRVTEPRSPAPPSSRQRRHAPTLSLDGGLRIDPRAGNFDWVRVGKRSYNLWIKATNVYYRQMTEGGFVVQGAYSATLWAWEGGHSRTIRIEFANELVKYEYCAIAGCNLVKRGRYSVADTRANTSAWFAPRPWIIEMTDADAYMRGHWKFIRAFHSRNVGVKRNLR